MQNKCAMCKRPTELMLENLIYLCRNCQGTYMTVTNLLAQAVAAEKAEVKRRITQPDTCWSCRFFCSRSSDYQNECEQFCGLDDDLLIYNRSEPPCKGENWKAKSE